MNRFKFLLFLLFIPFPVFASCDTSTLSRYKNLTSNIGNYYDYNGSNFDVTLYNVSNELRIVDRSNQNTYFSNYNLGNVVINNVSPGSTVRLAIYPINDDCPDYVLTTIYISLPYFNSYYSDPVCVNNSNTLCSKWANTSYYSYEQFVSEVSRKEDIEEEEKPKPNEKTDKYGFFDFLGDYYILMLLVIIIGGSIWIYYLDKKSKFDF